MSRFARLFDVYDTQVLFRLRREGSIIVLETITSREGEEQIEASYPSVDGLDDDAAWISAQGQLDALTEEDAKAVVAFAYQMRGYCPEVGPMMAMPNYETYQAAYSH